MILFAVLSLVMLICGFVWSQINIIADPHKTSERSLVGGKIVRTGKIRDLTDVEIRRRYLVFGLLLLPAIIFHIIYLTR